MGRKLDRLTGCWIDTDYGVPVEYISCPGCGKKYRGKVCDECEECSKCCQCETPRLIPATEMIQKILEQL